VLLCDEKGKTIDGDQVLALIATHLQAKGQLKGKGVVSTLMANLGLEHYLESQGLTLIRTAIGDRHVIEAMQRGGFNVGGEPSGHIILSDQSIGGDGLVVALSVLTILKEQSKTASELCHVFVPHPQVLKNIQYESHIQLSEAEINSITHDARLLLGDRGRILVRKSGTEPLLRVMIEGDDLQLVSLLAEQLAQQFKTHLGSVSL
jgi:phosphoglucosamine mutase